MIQLEQPLLLPEGQAVNISVEPIEEELTQGSPVLALKRMHEPPHLEPGDAEALQEALGASELPLERGGVFDEDGGD